MLFAGRLTPRLLPMGMTKDSGYSLERAVIRLGGAFALLVAVLPWTAFLFGLPLFLSGYTVFGDIRESLLLINSNKLSYAAFLIPFIVAALAILPVIHARALVVDWSSDHNQ